MHTILFVEDDPLIIQAYRGPLQARGFQVEVAADGLEAMKGLLQLRPELVLLDVLMPKVEGKYVLKFIRSRAELAATKVIILSEATFADAGSEAVAQHPDAIFLKSQCTPGRLVEKINELMGVTAPPAPLPPP